MKWGEMSSGPRAVLVLMLAQACSSCCCVNGSETGCEGSVNDETVWSTLVSSMLLNAGSLGMVDMFWICLPMILRLSTGVRDGFASLEMKGGRDLEDEATRRGQAVHTIL